jgi:hypothetical protein
LEGKEKQQLDKHTENTGDCDYDANHTLTSLPVSALKTVST